MAPSNQKPPMDPELRILLEKVSFPAIARITPEVIKMMRTATTTPSSYLDDQRSRGISHTEVRIPSQDGSDHEIILSILQAVSEPTKSRPSKPRPCLYWIHGGGFHWGDRLHTLEYATDVILEFDAICVSVEYRLAPEYSFSVAVEDCYTGLTWIAGHTRELGIDVKRIMIGGMSAGGGLAASMAQLCRDRQGPVVCAQCLICPALDDRLATISSQQFVETSDFMPTITIEDIWKTSLDTNRQEGPDAVVIPAGRVEDLSGLPPTYLDAGSAEVLRDDAVAYASRLWANGVQTELHIWPGGFHGFDIFLPDVAVSQAARKTKLDWVRRIFGL